MLTLIVILVMHWLCDFCLQSHKQASRKHKDLGALLEHTISYSLPWVIVMAVLYHFQGVEWFFINACLFAFITFISHTIIDFLTSRLGYSLLIEARKKDNYHNYFVNIGFDQLLHTIQLLLTYLFLLNY